MWTNVVTVIGTFIIAICFFIGHNQVVSFSAPSSRITYFFSPQCGDENKSVEAIILEAMNCYNATMGCSYNYIPVWNYSQVTHKPWFAPLAIFTIIYLVLHLTIFSICYCIKTLLEKKKYQQILGGMIFCSSS